MNTEEVEMPPHQEDVMESIAAHAATEIGAYAPVQAKIMFDNVLLCPLPKEVIQRPSGIIIDESVGGTPPRAVVVGVGHGRVNHNGELSPLEVKLGDHVYFRTEHLARGIVFERRHLLIVPEYYIIAITKRAGSIETK